MHRTLQDILWLVPAILELAIAVQMLCAGLAREYPAFWSYLIFGFLRTTLLFSIGNDNAHYAGYFYAFWESEIINCLLGFLVIVEIFRKAFAKRLGLHRQGTAMLQFSVVVLLVFALWIARESPRADPNHLLSGVLI